MLTIEDRAAQGAEILKRYAQAIPDWKNERLTKINAQSILGDLLSDLRHYAADQDLDFERAVLMSELHFNDETEG